MLTNLPIPGVDPPPSHHVSRGSTAKLVNYIQLRIIAQEKCVRAIQGLCLWGEKGTALRRVGFGTRRKAVLYEFLP